MDITAFNQQRLAAQYETFGKPAVIGGFSCIVCASPHHGRSQLEDGGMGLEHSRTVRCRMGDFATQPKEGAKATIDGRNYRVAEITVDHLAGEYVLGLEQMR